MVEMITVVLVLFQLLFFVQFNFQEPVYFNMPILLSHSVIILCQGW